jgi:bifunctional non-homologous end joining protein LigD
MARSSTGTSCPKNLYGIGSGRKHERIGRTVTFTFTLYADGGQLDLKPERRSVQHERERDRERKRPSIPFMITHPEKILFPDDGITKGELAAYYEAVASIMVPHMRARPVTMERYPAGIGKEGFFHKSVAKGFPAWLERVDVPKKDGIVHYPLVLDTRSLMWMVNQNCITPHVWTARVPDLFHPDICIFDLDPLQDEPAVLRAAALLLRDLLAELALPSWVKTTGSKGFHIAVPLDGKADSGEAAGFAHRVGRILVERNPKDLTLEFSKADRGGRILVDTGRNDFGATFAAAYAVRPRPGAPVSAPCTWEEVERGAVHPQSFGVRNIAERIVQVGDLWGDMAERAQSLSRPLAQLRTG